MTDRAEIERLLQMTGRTLEGLPTQDEYWYSDDYAVRNKMEAKIDSCWNCGAITCDKHREDENGRTD